MSRLHLATLFVCLTITSGIQDVTLQARVVPEGSMHLRHASTEVSHTKQMQDELSKVPPNKQGEYMRPVSVTLQCVMTLTILCMCVYTALSVSRNIDELSATFTPSTTTQMLTISSRVSQFAPMLCMLFVGCRMFVLATTEGLGEPPLWVKGCMQAAVTGVILQLVTVLSLPLFTKKEATDEASYDMTEGKKSEWEAGNIVRDDTKPPTEIEIAADVEGGASQAVTESTGEQNDVHPDLNRIELKKDSSAMRVPFWVLQGLSMLCIYGGVVGVIVGILTFPTQTTQISAAVKCTITLSGLYFATCFFLWAARACSENDSPFTNAALSMSTTARKIPMFCVLMLASRMRALQLDPPHGMPPFWMQCCFYSITGLLFLETIVGGFVGLTGEKTKGYYGVYLFRCPSKACHLVHHLFALATYGLLFPIVIGVTNMESASGEPAPLSVTLKCTFVFEAVYFTVMFMQNAIMFAEEYEEIDLTMIRDTAISAGVSLSLAPMLCILFVATRMRALQITQQMGAPPGWAQDCMMIAVFATCVQAACCLAMPIFIGSSCKVDDDGNPDYDLAPMVGAYAVAVVKYVALICLHASVIGVCIAVFVMTPETANNDGKFIKGGKDAFKGIAVVMGIFCVALLFSSAKVIGMAIKMAIESADEALLGVNITVEKVALNLFKGYVNVTKLKVHQPENEITYTRDGEGKLVGTPTGKNLEWEKDYIARVDLLLIKINVWRILTTVGKEFELENLSIKGIFANVEKPTADLRAEDANIFYILHHLEVLGLVPPPGQEAEPVSPKPDEPAVPEPQKDNTPEPIKEGDETDIKEDLGLPEIIIHKIVFGDIGASVCLRGLPVVNRIAFNPKIGLLEFNDVQNEIFNGRSDLKPGEMVACIISAFANKLCKSVTQEIPKQLKNAAKEAGSAVVDGVKTSVDVALKKVPCGQFD